MSQPPVKDPLYRLIGIKTEEGLQTLNNHLETGWVLWGPPIPGNDVQNFPTIHQAIVRPEVRQAIREASRTEKER